VNIGERIKERRKELELSVDDIASKLNKNRATIYRYESNDIENLPVTVLEPLAQILNTTPAYLLGLEDKKFELSKDENKIIKKYRNLDSKGKHTINTILDMEYNRCMSDDSLPRAAHHTENIKPTKEEIKHDLDIMEDDNEW
jgi:transcriptional regulator with XRE-family HTH domain